MNSDLKDNNLDNNNNDAINMFNVYMFDVHVILNSSEIIISDMIMYRYTLLRLKIESKLTASGRVELRFFMIRVGSG